MSPLICRNDELFTENHDLERSNAKLREECDQTKLEAETEQRRLGDEVARL